MTETPDLAQFFLVPKNTAHRQYEALRAFYLDGLPSEQVAERFGYTDGAFRNLRHQFRSDPDRCFFVDSTRKRKTTEKHDSTRTAIIDLRKSNLSIYDISDALKRDKGISLSPAAVSLILNQEGFSRLARRRDDERPAEPRPDPADVTDVRQFDLSPQTFRTEFGGLFLFLPYLAHMPFDQIVKSAGFPGSQMIPAGHALRALLALKLFGNARHSHIMSYVFDKGLGVFAGLNEIPKRSFLTEYSCRVPPQCHPELMNRWFDAVSKLGLQRGQSLDLDFHTIPYHGHDALVQKHYVSKRSRRQKGVLAFLARDAEQMVFCYANADIRKDQQNDEILEFVKFWKKRTGRLPSELVFDSKLTTYQNLNTLNKQQIEFITLRRRSEQMLDQINAIPRSAWRRIELENVTREFRTPRIIDTTIALKDYEGPIRQIAIADLGHEQPTFLVTNQLHRSAAKLVGRYARRMLIENGIADGIDFFHMDALSSAVALKINIDLQLTLMASSLYRLLGCQLGHGYEKAKSRHIFSDFIDASAVVTVSDTTVDVRFQKRAHNPFLLKAGFDKVDLPVSWWDRKRIRFTFG
jgi:transposase